ncbi:MAG: MTH938/NDUFAF3 family protein, partial [Nitratireductor sp.]
MAGGIIMREAHFPGRAPIDAYGNGGFRFAEMSHRGSILCVPSGIHGWEPAALAEADFDRILAEAQDIELLLVGTGVELKPLPKAAREA